MSAIAGQAGQAEMLERPEIFHYEENDERIIRICFTFPPWHYKGLEAGSKLTGRRKGTGLSVSTIEIAE